MKLKKTNVKILITNFRTLFNIRHQFNKITTPLIFKRKVVLLQLKISIKKCQTER